MVPPHLDEHRKGKATDKGTYVTNIVYLFNPFIRTSACIFKQTITSIISTPEAVFLTKCYILRPPLVILVTPPSIFVAPLPILIWFSMRSKNDRKWKLTCCSNVESMLWTIYRAYVSMDYDDSDW